MTLLSLRRQWDTTPTGLVVPQHPRGRICAISPRAVTPRPSARLQAVGNAVISGGYFYSAGSGTSYFTSSDSAFLEAFGLVNSTIFIGVKNGNTAQTNKYVINCSGLNQFTIIYGYASGRYETFINNGAYRRTIGYATGGDDVIAVRRVNQSQISLFFNGDLVVSETYNSGIGITGPFLTHASTTASTAANFIGGIYFLYAAPVLGDGEIAYISRDPWSVIRPRNSVTFSAGAPALPTLSALTTKPGTLTSTGFTTRVTAS